jgi:PAS domain S-box-containing protein
MTGEVPQPSPADSADLASVGSDEYSSLDAIPLHSSNLLTVIDADGVVRYESPAIERIFGFEQSALVGVPVSEYIHPEDRERVLEAFQSIVENETHTVETVEYRHACVDGSWCWVESVGSSRSTDDGHYVVNTRDVTDQKEREARLERQNERLAEFAQIVSHDLKNPLQVADGRLDLARETGADRYFEAVERAHDRMWTLIEDLLALALEGEDIADTESVALADLALQCWQTVDTGDATLDVQTDLVVLADESRLAQLLENLLQNAVEHGGDAVGITIGECDEGFFVEDDGPGIPESERERIFEAGYSEAGAGTGIGLGIVETIAEAHGWNVDAVRGSDGGARFEVTGVEFVEKAE